MAGNCVFKENYLAFQSRDYNMLSLCNWLILLEDSLGFDNFQKKQKVCSTEIIGKIVSPWVTMRCGLNPVHLIHVSWASTIWHAPTYWEQGNEQSQCWSMSCLSLSNLGDSLYQLKRLTPICYLLKWPKELLTAGCFAQETPYLQIQMHIYTLMNNEGYLLHVLEIMVDFGVSFIKPASKSMLRPDVFIAVQVK